MSRVAAAVPGRGAARRRRRRAGRGRPAVVVAGDDRQARDLAADLRAWLRPRPVRFYPSRGVAYESHLAPPPHLVGLRVAALDALLDAAGGDEPPVVVVSAVALSEKVPDPDAAPARLHAAPRATCSTSTRSRPSSSPPATSASTRSRTAGSSRSAAGSSTSTRRPRTTPSASTSSTSRSSRCAGSRRSPSARWATLEAVEIAPAAELARRAPRAGGDRRDRRRGRGPPGRRRAAAGRPLPRVPRPRAAERRRGPDRRRGGGRSPRSPTTGRTSAPPSTTPTPITSTSRPTRSRRRSDARARIRLSALSSRPADRVPRPGRRRRGALAEGGRARAREARALGLPHGRRVRRAAARASAPPTTSPACGRPGSTATHATAPQVSGEGSLRFAHATLRDGFIAAGLQLAVIPEHRLFRRRRAERTGGQSAASAARAPALVRRPAHRRHRRPRGPRPRALRGLRDEDRRRRHARLPGARVRRDRQGLHARRPAREDHPLRRRGRRAPAAQQARRQELGDDEGARPPRRAGARRRAAQPLRRAPPPHRPQLPRGQRLAARVRGRASRGRRRPTSPTRSSASRPTWSARSRWTA